MKIIVDMSVIASKDEMRTGLAQYGFRFLNGLVSSQRKDLSLLVVQEVAEEFAKLYPECELITYRLIRSGIPFRPFFNSLLWRKTVNSCSGDLLFRIAQIPKYNFWKINKKEVVTLHDLNVLHLSPKSFIYRLAIGRALKNADHIITISNFVRSDLIKFYPKIPDDKVSVIYNGVPIPSFHHVSLPFDGPYIMTVNSLLPYKNVLTLLKAFASIIDVIPHKLVIVGKETAHFNTVLYPFIKDNGVQDRVIHIPFANDDLLYTLYERTDLFITTSTLEGFGFTPIEAALMETRVLSTLETALPESTLNLVNYYSPPTDETVLANKIIEVLSKDDSQEKKEIRKRLLDTYDIIAQSGKIHSLLESIV